MVTWGRTPGIFSQTASVTRASSTDELTLLGAGIGSLTLPANFWTVGKTIIVKAWGHYGTKNGGQGNSTMKLKLGGTAVYSDTHALDQNLGNDELWQFTGVMTCRTVGGSGTIFTQCNCEHTSDNPATDEWHAMTTPNTTTATIDTTGALAIDFTHQFSVSDANNTRTCTHFLIYTLM